MTVFAFVDSFWVVDDTSTLFSALSKSLEMEMTHGVVDCFFAGTGRSLACLTGHSAHVSVEGSDVNDDTEKAFASAVLTAGDAICFVSLLVSSLTCCLVEID